VTRAIKFKAALLRRRAERTKAMPTRVFAHVVECNGDYLVLARDAERGGAPILLGHGKRPSDALLAAGSNARRIGEARKRRKGATR